MLTMILLLPVAATQPLDTFADVTGWSVNADGSQGVTFAPETELAPQGLRIRFDASGANRWGNLARSVTVPPTATELTLRVQIVSAAPGASMFVWLFEPDGDAWMTSLTAAAGQPVTQAPPGTWQEVTVPLGKLAFQPRGDGQKAFLTANKLLLGCNFAPVEVVVTDLAWQLGNARGDAPPPTTPDWQVAEGPAGRVGLLADPALPRSPGASDPESLAAALGAAGFGVTRLLAGDLCLADRLAPLDVVVLPHGPAWPATARPAVLEYLKAGGSLVASGGYAFDELLDWSGEAWVSRGVGLQAQDLDGTQPPALLNSRLGTPGDTMTLPDPRIGLFDPSDTFELVDRADWAEREIRGPVEGFVGRSLAGTNSPVFPDQHGETEPLGMTYDRTGAERGAVGVLAQFFAGPFNQAGWAGFGVTNRDLFATDGFGPEALVGVVQRLATGVFLHSLTADPVLLEPGETATLSVQVRRRGRLEAGPWRVQLRVNDELVTEQPVAPEQFGDVTVEASWKPAGPARPVERVTATLLRGETVEMTRETGLVRRQPEVLAGGPRVAWQDNQLLIDGRPGTWVGTNQTGVMWHSPRENPLTWDADFRGMAEHGYRIWRILHFSPFAQVPGGENPRNNPLVLANTPPERLVRQTDAIVQLAQQHGVVIMLCAHDWIGTVLPDDQLEAERVWNRFWAARYRDVPGVIWDIQNEPSVTYDEANPPAWLLDLYWQFAATEAGSPAAARELLTLPADAPLRPGKGQSWDDPAGLLRERFRTWLLDRWVRVNLEGLREGNPNALVTVGYLQSRSPADKILGSARLNFSNMHSYEPPRNLAASMKFIDRRAYGGGLGLGEFGQRASHDARAHGQFGDQRAADAARFSASAAITAGLGGNMLSTWFWRDLPDVIFPWGIQTPDRRFRPWVAELDAWTAALQGLQPVYTPPRLYVLVPDGQRLGNDFARYDAALQVCFETLLGLDVPFACLTETELPTIPAEATALLWPLPYAPTDAAFDAVAAWVAQGGHLYVSGGLGFDTWRRPTRSARYAALGLPAREDAPPDLAQVTGQPAVVAGRVTFVPEPAELGPAASHLRERYRDFLAAADLPRLPVTPDSPEVHAWRLDSREGGHAWVATSWGEARTVICGTAPAIGLTIAADHGGLVQVNPAGAVSAVVAGGPVAVGGAPVSDGPGYFAQAADQGDLRAAPEVRVLPLAPGPIILTRTHPSRARLADGGEVPAAMGQGTLTLTIDAALVGRWIVVETVP